ncbi:hypothetical protein GCM10022252_46960 [Streptosporangium oxazolinicum]|uniref:Uncharacterized protein n=1 Tax=Streptosporangium oxazolinicum TaxID=909287 RepID=A0ABP8B4I2_9ACTN
MAGAKPSPRTGAATAEPSPRIGAAPAGTVDAADTAVRDTTETTVIAAINFPGAMEGVSRPSDVTRRGTGG